MRALLYLAATALALLILIFVTQNATTWAAHSLEKRYPPPGRMVAVGGYSLQLYCSGAGSPTVVIEPGMGVDWIAWRKVIAKLLPANRVCVYDRAGYGWSDPGPKPRTALLESTELHTLLSRAGVPPPYILAAHSYGAYIARIEASQYRGSVAGLVLVDPSYEDEPARGVSQAAGKSPAFQSRIHELLDLVPPLGIQRLRRLYRGEVPRNLQNEPRFYADRYLIASSLTQLKFERNEFDSLSLTKAQVRKTVFPRDLPLTVITATHSRAGSDAPYSGEHERLQARLASSSAFGKQILALHSGHMIPLDEPELVVSAIQEMARQPSGPLAASAITPR